MAIIIYRLRYLYTGRNKRNQLSECIDRGPIKIYGQNRSMILSFVIKIIIQLICFYVCYKNCVCKESIQSWSKSRLDSFRGPFNFKFYNERSLSFNNRVHSAPPTPSCKVTKSLSVFLGLLDRVSFGFVKLPTRLVMLRKHPWYSWHKSGWF